MLFKHGMQDALSPFKNTWEETSRLEIDTVVTTGSKSFLLEDLTEPGLSHASSTDFWQNVQLKRSFEKGGRIKWT